MSWQPCGGDLAGYRCRHGLSCSAYECAGHGINAAQTLFIPRKENVELWDGDWYIRGITADGRKIGTHTDEEGKVYLESNTWAVLSGAAQGERAVKAMDAVDQYLYTDYGIRLNAPSYTRPDDAIGFITRVYPGVKENGSIVDISQASDIALTREAWYALYMAAGKQLP